MFILVTVGRRIGNSSGGHNAFVTRLVWIVILALSITARWSETVRGIDVDCEPETHL
jgi:hypothetical protein